MKVILIRDDAMIGVDGVFRKVDVSDLDPTVHAIVFDTVTQQGNVKYGDSNGWANVFITDFSAYQVYVSRWTAAAPVLPPPPTPAELARLAAIDDSIKTNTLGTVTAKTITELKALSVAEWSAWFDLNFTTAALLIGFIKRLALIVIRRM